MKKGTFTYFVFNLLIICAALQFSSYGLRGENYSILRNSIILIMCIVFALSFRNPMPLIRRIPAVRIHFFACFVFVFILIILSIIGVQINFNPARDLLIALIVLIIGLNLNITKKQFVRLCTIYIALYTISALSIVFTFSSGFSIQEIYLSIPKNQIAPAFGVAAMLSIYFFFLNKGFLRYFYFSTTVLIIASLLVIRGRAVIIAVILTWLVFNLFFLRNAKFKVLNIVFVFLLVPFVGKHVYDSLFLNYDISSIESISAGRVSAYLLGVEFFLNNPLSGMLLNDFHSEHIIHNYILYNIVNFGVILSPIMLIIYFRYILLIVYSVYRNSFGVYEVGPLMMVIIMIVSLFEYTYPYSPGSAVFFPFFLMGQYLKHANGTAKIRCA